MYTTTATQDYLAERINTAQAVAGSPIRIMQLPVTVQAFGNYPADFTFTDTVNPDTILRALVVVSVKVSETKHLTSPRWTRVALSTNFDAATGIPISGYINPNAGMVEENTVVDVMVMAVGKTMSQSQSTRDKVMDGISTLFQTSPTGVVVTEPTTGAIFHIKTLGERVQKKTDLTERGESGGLFISRGYVYLPDLLITYKL